MDELAKRAIEVLHGNDRGTWTRPSPRLYPHQWSWDAAFVAMGWAQLDPVRALNELWSLLRGQWSTGMIPQIVFDLNVGRGKYEPGPNTWGTILNAPPGIATSGICQPPVHAIAVARIREVAAGRADGTLHEVDDAIVDLYPRLDRWHRWLRTARDPEGTGLVTILHPWESGLDNSPRWDRPLSRVEPDEMDDLPRPDLTCVADPAERPTNPEYQRYRHLVDRLIAVDYDQDKAMAEHPFRVADVFFSAILATADDVLADLAAVAGRPEESDRHRTDAARTRQALDCCWDPDLQACLDQDRITGRPIRADTIGGFAPLIAGCDLDRSAVLVDRLLGPTYAGADGLVWPLPLSTATTDPRFDRRGYWRGPQWPPITWLLWRGLKKAGHHRTANTIRTTAIDQLRDVGCTEYVEPFSGRPLGSAAQSWSAAVALDLLSYDP
ncbi:MGH1-like glycoside hydrolase domain-containing protein [Aquihabitans sp. McL0605]|uniref:MGH1-like glycoside hydrolase domain-containing protein n=1 Tax=Aquihabitans sp. McL0605 TaxID=3415671 RepID=UPI003CEA12F4